MSEQTVEKPIGKFSNVKHIKSGGRSQWYQKLVNGVLEHISKSGKSAEVKWYDQNGKYLHFGTYKIENLQHIEEEAK